MKLGIFIPAYNEADTIADVIKEMPLKVDNFKAVKVFIVDDGSSDDTLNVSGETIKRLDTNNGNVVFEILSIKTNQGLANAYKTGLKACLDWGADVVAHFDADGQYVPSEIGLLVAPILSGKADFVTGDRQVANLKFMDGVRKYGNLLGSAVVRCMCGIKVKDASCGFRAYSRRAAERLEVYSQHTYTHETLLQVKPKGFRFAQVPINFRPRGKKGRSRLTHRLIRHIFRSMCGIFASWRRYRNGKR